MVRGHLRKRLVLRKQRRHRRSNKLPQVSPRSMRPLPLKTWARTPTDYKVYMHGSQFSLRALYFLLKYNRLCGEYLYQYWYLIHMYMLYELTRYFFFKRLKGLRYTKMTRELPRPQKRGTTGRFKRVRNMRNMLGPSRFFAHFTRRLVPTSPVLLSRGFYLAAVHIRKYRILTSRYGKRHPRIRHLYNRRLKTTRRRSFEKVVYAFNELDYYDEANPWGNQPVEHKFIKVPRCVKRGYYRYARWAAIFKYFLSTLPIGTLRYRLPVYALLHKLVVRKIRALPGTRRRLAQVLSTQRRFLAWGHFLTLNAALLHVRMRTILQLRGVRKQPNSKYLRNYFNSISSWLGPDNLILQSPSISMNTRFKIFLNSILRLNFKYRYTYDTQFKIKSHNLKAKTYLKKEYSNIYTNQAKLYGWRYSKPYLKYSLAPTRVPWTRTSSTARRYNIFNIIMKNYFIRGFWKQQAVRFSLRFFLNLGQRVGGHIYHLTPRSYYRYFYYIRRGLPRPPVPRKWPRQYMRRYTSYFTRRLLKYHYHFLYRLVVRWASYLKKLGRLRLHMRLVLVDEPITFSFFQKTQENLYGFLREYFFEKFYAPHVKFMYLKTTGFEGYYPDWFPRIIKECAFYDLPLDMNLEGFFADITEKCNEAYLQETEKFRYRAVLLRSYKHFGLKFYNNAYYPTEAALPVLPDITPIEPIHEIGIDTFFIMADECYAILVLLIFSKVKGA